MCKFKPFLFYTLKAVNSPLSTVVTESHHFWSFAFLLFSSKYLISILISSLINGLLRSMLLNTSILRDFVVIVIFKFNCHHRHTLYNFNFNLHNPLKFTDLVFGWVFLKKECACCSHRLWCFNKCQFGQFVW